MVSVLITFRINRLFTDEFLQAVLSQQYTQIPTAAEELWCES